MSGIGRREGRWIGTRGVGNRIFHGLDRILGRGGGFRIEAILVGNENETITPHPSFPIPSNALASSDGSIQHALTTLPPSPPNSVVH